MRDAVFGDRRVQFPVTVHYRILCVAGAEVRNAVWAAAAELGLADALREGNPSRGGAYQSYQLSVLVHDEIRMNEIDRVFRAVPGVKMVL